MESIGFQLQMFSLNLCQKGCSEISSLKTRKTCTYVVCWSSLTINLKCVRPTEMWSLVLLLSGAWSKGIKECSIPFHAACWDVQSGIQQGTAEWVNMSQRIPPSSSIHWLLAASWEQSLSKGGIGGIKPRAIQTLSFCVCLLAFNLLSESESLPSTRSYFSLSSFFCFLAVLWENSSSDNYWIWAKQIPSFALLPQSLYFAANLFHFTFGFSPLLFVIFLNLSLSVFPLPQFLICQLTSFMLFLLLMLILAATSLILSPLHRMLDTGHSPPPCFGFPELPCWFVSVGYVLEKRSGGFPPVWRVSPQAVCVHMCVSLLEMASKWYFEMLVFIKAQGCMHVYVYVCVCLSVCFIYIARRGHACSFLLVIALDMHTRGWAHTWPPAFVCVCSAHEIHDCVSACTPESASVHAYIWVSLCSCFLRINNAIQPDYESAEQTDTDCAHGTRSQIKHMWNSVSDSTFRCRMTQECQSFGAKMATLDLNQSIGSVLWEAGGVVAWAATAPTATVGWNNDLYDKPHREAQTAVANLLEVWNRGFHSPSFDCQGNIANCWPECHSQQSTYLSVLVVISAAVMPWYTSVSFHTGFNVFFKVFVRSLLAWGDEEEIKTR